MIKCENACPRGKFDGCCHKCPDFHTCPDSCQEDPNTCGSSTFDEEAGLQAFQQSQLATLNAIASLTSHKKAIEEQEKTMKAALYLIPAVFTELGVGTGFYYSKAKAENRIKLRKMYGPEIYNDTKEM